MKKLIFLISVAASLAPCTVATARAQDSKLTVAQDESSTEKSIEQYLKTKHDMVIIEKNLSPDDLYLELPMKGGTTPAYKITIDTQPLNHKDDRVSERGIRIQGYTGVKVPDAKLEAVQKVINELNRDKVFSAIYVDKDGEIILDWTLNILEPGLDAEYVYDALAREDGLWRTLYPRVIAALQ